MDRKSLTSIAVLAASITLSCIPITAQQNGEPLNVERSRPLNPVPRQTQADAEKPKFDKGERSQQPSTTSPITSPLNVAPPTPRAATPGKETDKYEPPWFWSYEPLFMIIFSGLLVVIGAGQIVFLVSTARSTKIAADAAKENADTARDTLHLTQRADVQIDNGVEFSDQIPELLRDTQLKFVLRNFGPTKARQVETHSVVFIDNVQLDRETSTTAQPDIGGHGTLDFSLTPSAATGWADVKTLERINGGSAPFEITLMVNYLNIFNDEPHSTGVTFRFRPPSQFVITQHEAN
jgi:hypothetical protein